jgi:hypothetical protein
MKILVYGAGVIGTLYARQAASGRPSGDRACPQPAFDRYTSAWIDVGERRQPYFPHVEGAISDNFGGALI